MLQEYEEGMMTQPRDGAPNHRRYDRDVSIGLYHPHIHAVKHRPGCRSLPCHRHDPVNMTVVGTAHDMWQWEAAERSVLICGLVFSDFDRSSHEDAVKGMGKGRWRHVKHVFHF
jgi:hypothetical protein